MSAKITVEAEVEDNLVEDFIDTMKALSVLTRANEDLNETIGALSKSIAKNSVEIRRLSKTVESLIESMEK